jgi:hypothetical protein
MTAPDLDALLELAGATLVTEATLPGGPGVVESEEGEPGPWYGFRVGDGPVWGWTSQLSHLEGQLLERVVRPRQLLAALLAAREERSRDAVATAALYADLLAAREEVVGYMQAMNNLGATLQRVEAERGRARGTGEYWKAEHNAANAALDAALALVAECAELVDRLRELRAPRDIEEGSLILNTCDYYALDDLAERLRAARPAPETAE